MRPGQYQLSICAIFKNESSYLKEWIEFHCLAGIEHFYLYDNNSTDDFHLVLDPYIREGVVDLYPWPKYPGQMEAYSDCILTKANTKWLAVIDLDEFLFPVIKNTLGEALDEFDKPDIAAVCVFWRLFNSSGAKRYVNDYVINRFKQYLFSYQPHVKSIVRPERVTVPPVDPHLFVPKQGFVNVDENHKRLTAAKPSYRVDSKLCINHYWTKSLEEWKQKCARGRATTNRKRTKGILSFVEKSPVKFDDRITKYLPELRKKVFLPESPPLPSREILPLLCDIPLLYDYAKLKSRFFSSAVKPWMTCEETLIIQNILARLQPEKCLEWGSGYGTLYFPPYGGKRLQWQSVEHDSQWAERIKGMNQNPNILISHIKPNHFPWSDIHHDGAYSDLRDYVDFPIRMGPFDFILVDGRARKDCLIKAYDLVSEKGVVVLHDAERKYYHQPFELYPHQFLFDYSQTGIRLWMGSKGLEVNKEFNLPQYQRLKSFSSFLTKVRNSPLFKAIG